MFKRTLIAAILMSSFTVSTAFADVVVSVSHEVKDFATWKKGFDGDKAMRKKAGFKDLYVAQDIAKPNLIYIAFTAKDEASAKAFIANPKLKETMEKCGVISTPTIVISTLVTK